MSSRSSGRVRARVHAHAQPKGGNGGWTFRSWGTVASERPHQRDPWTGKPVAELKDFDLRRYRAEQVRLASYAMAYAQALPYQVVDFFGRPKKEEKKNDV